MQTKICLLPSVIALGLAAIATPAAAAPLGSGSSSAVAPRGLVQQVWHSGLPHRRVVGDRVYGGRCPPQGCPLWTQRDITPDPRTGRYRYYAAPPSEGYGPGTYATPRGYRYYDGW
ncbi:MAG: hypothetical protein ACRECO_17915 [Xanthobacteraceae bacterium]